MGESLGKCSVCRKDAVVVYPLLDGCPAFCNKHHNPKHAEPFGCDFTGPDDFDISDDISFNTLSDRFIFDCFGGAIDSKYPFLTDYKPKMFKKIRKRFIWTDKHGNEHKLKDIDNFYLSNIINFLTKRNILKCFDDVIRFLSDELEYRREVEKLK